MIEMSDSDHRDKPCEVAVLIVAYNSRDDLARCLAGMERWAEREIILHVVVVDCDSQDGSAELVRDLFPEVDVVDAGGNLGFAGGNNVGWAYVRNRYPGVSYLALLNPDTLPEPGWLDPLVDHLEENPDAATCQPLITLLDRPGHINTAGNRCHFLGFGFVTLCGEPIPSDLSVQRIDYSSGAAMLIRVDPIALHGLFESEMFMYCEDTDLGWKLSQLGFVHELVPDSRVAHRFQPGESLRHYYWLERNRLWLLCVYYRLPTLLLILPAFLVMELGQIFYAAMHGHLRDKLRAYAYFLNPEHRVRIADLRQQARQRRRVRDREFLRRFAGTIDYPTLRNEPLVRYVANPLLGVYWWVVKRLICW
ncbi:MAG: glycosyltransferase family 2 protein [Phycisphaeraceae bacterium]